jgi:serine/threonine protein kinase/tetratricopeptide (TPR) repeat protein
MDVSDDLSGDTIDLIDLKDGARHRGRLGRPKLERGATLGRYVVLDELGAGGMAVVYKAYDPELDRAVALKLLNSNPDGIAGQRERLLREAQALARLSHPNVIAVHDVGTFGDNVFLATEFVEGMTVRQWLKVEPRSRSAILEVFLAAGEGLAAAHAAGLVHRDFKPDNVMVGKDGRVRVLDFGLARVASSETTTRPPHERDGAAPLPREDASSPEGPKSGSHDGEPLSCAVDSEAALRSGVNSKRLSRDLTRAGSVLGTPRFMAPEQHRGEPVDERADQFAFCLSLYEALYGAPPFAGASLSAMREHVLAGRIADPPSNARVPRWLRQLLVRGLAVDPVARHRTMAHLLSLLRADPLRRRRRRLLVGTVVAAVGMVVSVWRLDQRQQVRSCAGAERKLAGVWDEPRRAAVRTAFLRSQLPYAEPVLHTVVQTLDDYTRSWATMHTDACEATLMRAEQSQELLDLRMSCLSDRLTQVKALTDLFTSADSKVVERAVQSAQSLPSLHGCADAVTLRAAVPPPDDAQTRQRVTEVRQEVARAHALELAARYDEGIKAAHAVVEEIATLHYRPVEAEAQANLASMESALGKWSEAKTAWHRALAAAMAGRNDQMAATAAIRLVYVIGVRQNQLEEGDRWADLAESIVERLQNKDELLGRLYEERSALRRRESRPADALHDAKQALALQLRVHGPQHSLVADAYDNLGRVYYQMAQYDLALENHQRALAIDERALGADHPTVAGIRFSMANAYGDGGEHERAIAEYRRTLATFQRIDPQHSSIAVILNNLGDELAVIGKPEEALAAYRQARVFYEKQPSSFDTAILFNNIGEVELELEQAAEAKEHFKQGLEISERAMGSASAPSAVSLWGIGEASRRQGQLDDALAHFRRALPIAEKTFGAKHPQVARPLIGMGRVYLARHQAESALAPLRRALAIREAQAGDRAALVEARFVLAQALWASGERDAAQMQAMGAARDGRAAGAQARRLADEVDRWFATHR